MSFLLKKDDSHGAKADLSTFINKSESILDRESPRRMEILIKQLDDAETKGVEPMDVANIGGSDDTADGHQTLDNNTQSDKNVVSKVNNNHNNNVIHLFIHLVCAL